MDEQRKPAAREPVSREKMLEYLYRHKLKKKYRPVRPHTFANSQGLSTRQLQKEPSVDAKKPIISKNVKARLESNLQFLLENQNLNAARVRKPESFISLNVKRLKAGGTSTNTKSIDGSTQTGESHHSGSNQDKQRKRSKVTSTVVSMQKSPSFHNTEQSQRGHRLMSPPNLPSRAGQIGKKHKKDRQSDALTFSQMQTPPLVSNRSSLADSFDFRSVEHQNQAGHQFTSHTSSKSRQTGKRGKNRLSEGLEFPSSAFRINNDGSFGFDPVQTRNRAARTQSDFSDAPDPFFDNQLYQNDAARARGWTVSSNFDKHSNSFDAECQSYNRSRSSGHLSSANLIDILASNTSSANRSGRGTVQKTRITKSSVSRIGESPFMEQIVIQKMKQKF